MAIFVRIIRDEELCIWIDSKKIYPCASSVPKVEKSIITAYAQKIDKLLVTPIYAKWHNVTSEDLKEQIKPDFMVLAKVLEALST